MIFSINPGRCGSKYISSLLSLDEKILAVHEEKPLFDSVMRKGQNDRQLIKDFIKNEKLPIMNSLLKQYNKNIYLETSHIFGCGFFEEFINLNIIPDILIIKRDPISVAKSLFSLNTIPERSTKGLKYLISPYDDNIKFKLNDYSKLNDFQLCYWYVLEIYKRAEEYSRIILEKGGKTFETSIGEIKKIDHFENLCKIMGGGVFDIKKYKDLCKNIINDKKNKKVRNITNKEVDIYIKEFEEKNNDMV